MPTPKINLDPDDVIDWLLESGYVEPTSIPSHPYRIAISEDDYMPYSFTFLTRKLSERFSKIKLSSGHRRAWARELRKCLDEFQIQYYDKGTRGNMHWEFKMTVRKWLEQKLGIDLEIVDNYDRIHKGNRHRGGKRWQSYWLALYRKYSEEDALRFFRDYFVRRMIDPSKDLKVGRKGKRIPINMVYGDLEYDSQRKISTTQSKQERAEVD